jgi:hypothetical protein
MRHFYILLIFISLPLLTLAQDPTLPENSGLEQKLENIGSGVDDELDYSTLLESLSLYLQNPMDLNRIDTQEWVKSGLMDEFQANALAEHIRKFGKLMRHEELQVVPGFDLPFIYRILPYIKAGDGEAGSTPLRAMLTAGKHTVILRYQRTLETQKGFTEPTKPTDTRYLGSPDKVYLKYRYQFSNKLSFGITAEKDAGEEFYKGSNSVKNWYEPYQGFDFYSTHLFYKGKKRIRTIAVGDYQVEYGQGLTVWSGLAFGKSNDITSIRKTGQGIKPYTSVNENLFLRGGAVSLGKKNFTTDFFYSSHKIDGNISALDSLDQVEAFSSFQETGYHRTLAELTDKNKIHKTLYGAHVGYRKKSLDLGFTAMHTEFAAPLKKTFYLYNKYDFQAKEIQNYGVHYAYRYRNFSFFGETAYSGNDALATVNGMMVSLDPRLSFSVLYRNYSKEYQALQANPVAESKGQNEKGLYMGFNAKMSRKWNISAYIDRFSFPWLKYQVDAPSEGYEYLTQIDFTPSRKLSFYARYKFTHKQENNTGIVAPVDVLVDKNLDNFRLNMSMKVTNSITLRNRVEFANFEKKGNAASHGYVIYQDVSFNSLKSPFTWSLRYALFDTDTYDSRIYAYENDVLYAFSIPSYYYKGSRFYITTKYHIKRGMDLWLRYSRTYFSNRTVVGSSLDEIQGRNKSEVKAQLRFTF